MATIQDIRKKTIISYIKKLLRPSSQKKTVKTNAVDPAYIVERTQHRLSKAHVSQNALTVLHHLSSAGYEAYIVGGGVRDLLLNHQPKDFDVATNATPSEVRKLFRHARIIGRRFKLVHVWFNREIIEVATFRKTQATHEHQQTNQQGMLIRDNVYGNLLDDVMRRDFTINAVYYAAETGDLIDVTGGVKDIQHRVIRMIGDPNVRYQEDPVRILRAIRFAAKLDFTIAKETEAPLYTLAPLIRHVAASRLFDEVVKLYQCGQAVKAHALLLQYQLFSHLFPKTHHLLHSTYPVVNLIELALKSTDARIREQKPVTPAFLFAVFLWFPLQAQMQHIQETANLPLINALEQAMALILSEQSKVISIPRRYTQMMREVWILQYRLHKRLGGRAQHILKHPRFRAAYDMLALRALVNDAPLALADWWTRFQAVDDTAKDSMVNALIQKNPKKRKK